MNPTTIRSRPWSENIKAMYNQIHFFKNFIAYVLFVRNKFSWISLVKYSTNLRIKRNTFLNFHLWEHHYWKKIYFLYLLIYWKYGIHEIRIHEDAFVRNPRISENTNLSSFTVVKQLIPLFGYNSSTNMTSYVYFYVYQFKNVISLLFTLLMSIFIIIKWINF